MKSMGQDSLNENADELAARPDDPLVTAVQAGVPEAFAQLHALYSSRLYSTIMAITKNPEDAQDALQETFLRTHLRVNTFEGRSSIYCWLSRIAINSALLILRKRRTRSEVLFDPPSDDRYETNFFEFRDPAPNPEETSDSRLRLIKTLRAIRRLNPKLRAAIQIQMEQRLSVREISQVLNISESAVKSRLHRARHRLSMTRGDQKSFTTHLRQSPAAGIAGDSVLPALIQGYERRK